MKKPKKRVSQPLSIEPLEERIDLNQMLTGGSESALLIQIEGDSAEGIPIFDGDFIIIERAGEPKENDIVITHENGEYAIKRYAKPDARRGPYLVTKEAGKAVDKSEVFGVVMHIIRSLIE